MPRIDGARLIGDLRRLAEFGRYQTGVHRPCLSDVDIASRHWLVERMAEAGLEARIDGIGNVIGRSRSSGPCLLMGSHTDTQPRGGWLDGAMGVIYGIEVARAFRDDPDCRGLGIDVASWADEEGNFGSFTGSRSFIGALDEAEIDKAVSREDGVPLRQCLAKAGVAQVPRAQVDQQRYRGYLEAHIEQGGKLEAGKKRIGVVTGIVGIYLFRVTFAGQQNHAGTTPMPIRRDAGVALTELCHAIHGRFRQLAGPLTVWTVGQIQLDPNMPSIIPGKATMLLQIRDPEPDKLDELAAEAKRLAETANAVGPCQVTIEQASHTLPTKCHPAFMDALDAAAERHAPGLWMRMPSGAGHDAQILAKKLPSAMLFVPSIKGVSHHFSEDTSEADIALGCQVFADAAAAILKA
jgi:beta-ureidopropionase / N-carbamoyl-L-amino-acid hydrolase